MVHPTAAARLVAPARGALSLTPGLPRTAAGTVNLAAVAAAADQYLRLAASAQEQPGRRFRRLRRAAAWTPSATGGIMPRHACSAPCGARRRTRAWQFRSAPCLPIGRLSSRHCALDTRHSARGRVRAAGRPVDMWTTQGRCPHPHRRSKRQHQVDCFEGEEVSQVTSPRRLRHLCADRDSHLQLNNEHRCSELRSISTVRVGRMSSTSQQTESRNIVVRYANRSSRCCIPINCTMCA